MNIREKLMNIQAELKAPKSQDNNFGKYKYRSAEDILEAAKPLLKKYESTLNLSDSVLQIGERYYVEATAILSDIKDDSTISVKAYAREENEKKGMDQAQVTGSASSYARKYALNGLFAIDDTKDSDFTNDKKDEKPEQKPTQKPPAGKNPQDTPQDNRQDNPQQKATTAIPPKNAEIKPTPFVQPAEPTCDDCGEIIKDHKNSKGVIYTAEEIIKGSASEYNHTLCYACTNKRYKARQAELRAQQAKK